VSRAYWQLQPQLSLALHRLSQSLEARKRPPSAEPNARSAERGTSNPSGQTRKRPRSSACTAAMWGCSRIPVLTEMAGTRGTVRLIGTDNHALFIRVGRMSIYSSQPVQNSRGVCVRSIPLTDKMGAFETHYWRI